jgi:hypothetical protein
MDLKQEQERDRQRRMEQAERTQKDSTVNSAGRFGLAERRKQEEQARIDAHRRAQARDLLRRTLMREPTDEEVANALAR